jgi:hypothetical protein
MSGYVPFYGKVAREEAFRGLSPVQVRRVRSDARAPLRAVPVIRCSVQTLRDLREVS